MREGLALHLCKGKTNAGGVAITKDFGNRSLCYCLVKNVTFGYKSLFVRYLHLHIGPSDGFLGVGGNGMAASHLLYIKASHFRIFIEIDLLFP